MNDFEVKEVAGVRGTNPIDSLKGRQIYMAEWEAHLILTIVGIGDAQVRLTIADARKLADQLRRLALRVERRVKSALPPMPPKELNK